MVSENGGKGWALLGVMVCALWVWGAHGWLEYQNDREYEAICAKIGGIAVKAADYHHCLKPEAFVNPYPLATYAANPATQ